MLLPIYKGVEMTTTQASNRSKGPSEAELNAVLERLEEFPVVSLRQVRSKTDSLIELKETADKQQALDEISLLIEQRGLSTDELRQHIFPPKFAHPEDPTKTWSGKGKKATWLQTEIAAGKRMEEFLNPNWQKPQNGKS